jgi:hypothetical protein
LALLQIPLVKNVLPVQEIVKVVFQQETNVLPVNQTLSWKEPLVVKPALKDSTLILHFYNVFSVLMDALNAQVLLFKHALNVSLILMVMNIIISQVLDVWFLVLTNI